MDIGVLLLADGEPGLTLPDIAHRARELEDYGFSTFWAPDHVVTFETYKPNYSYSADGLPPMGARQGFYDPLWVLAAVAGATSRIRLGTSIVILPERNPVLFAKEVVALDHLSNGRVDLGVGIGWSTEEFAALGVPFERRGARTSEYITAMQTLWTEDLASMSGEFVQFSDVIALPKPIQRPGPPIIMGGQSPAAFTRLAQHGDGWISWLLPEDQVKPSIESARRACEQADRDPASVRLICSTIYTTLDDAKRYRDTAWECGVHELALAPVGPGGYPAQAVEEIAANLIA